MPQWILGNTRHGPAAALSRPPEACRDEAVTAADSVEAFLLSCAGA
ncbi:hypothetical protein [Methylosarcina fibrata]|nr:hypothetical protein [Methylosarcina fibrata]